MGVWEEEWAGVTTLERPRTLGELKASGYEVLPVREEMRKNLIAKMRAGEELFPGIVGYEETVIPQHRERHPRPARTSSSSASAARRRRA